MIHPSFAVFLTLIVYTTQAAPPINYNKNCRIVKQTTICKNMTLKANIAIKLNNYTTSLKILPPVQEIPPRIFVSLGKLESLIINYTLMEQIYPESFAGLPNLKTLDLYWNQIPYIPPKTFHGSPNLVYLNIGGNNLEYIESEVFRPLKNMRNLIISSNLLTSVPDLRNLLRLESLDLSNNKIQDLRKESFLGLPSLTSLNLKGNQLRAIERRAFTGLNKLTFLNVEKNDLQNINVDDVKESLPQLLELRLNINQFECDVLAELVRNFTQKDIYVPEGLAEPGPITYHGIFCLVKRDVDD